MISGDERIGVALNPDFLASARDAETYEAAVSCAKGQGWPAQCVVNATITSVIHAVAEGRPPKIIVVDVDGTEEEATMVEQLVKSCHGMSQIVVIGTANDVSFYRSMIQAGASDYMVKPVSGIALRDAILPLMNAKKKWGDDKAGDEPGKLSVIIGARGGVGATTLAVNTSWLLAHEAGKKTALVDLDLQFGTCDLALDLEAGRGLRDVLTNPDRLDALLINSAMSKESDQLCVFCCEESLEELVDYDTSGPLALMKELRVSFEHIVVDLPKALVPRHRRLVVSADHVFIVSDLTLAGIRDTQRILASVVNLGTAAKIHVVITGVGDGEPQIKPSQFERSVRLPLAVIVPHDTRSAKLSANRGMSVFEVGAEGSPLARSIRDLASIIQPEGLSVAKKSGLLDGLLGGFSGRKG